MSDSRSDVQSLESSLMKALGPLESYRLKPSRIRVEKGEDYVSGGFGSVHRGTMNKGVFSSGTAVAVKKLRSAGDRSQRLRIAIALVREVKVWAGLRHRNILPLIGFYLNDSYDEAWLVCPWITNGSVAHYIARIRVSPEERLRLAIDTAEGLKHLHTRKPPICHGDIKAGNVLVADDGHAMLCDFGLARTTEAFSTGLTTANFDSAGSRRYQSPELILGEVSRRSLESDVWAWGCLLLEIFTGHSPYHTIANETSLVLRVSQNEVPASLLNEDMPAFVKDLLARCWQRQPEERPSMRQCLSALCQMPFSLDEAFTIRTDRNPTCHRFSRDGKYFAITFSKAICIYDTQTWEVLRELQAPMPPFCVRFSDNNRYLTAVAELFVMLYDLESGQLLPTMVESLNGAYDAEVASDGSFVTAVQKGDTPVHIWYPCDKEKGQPIPALAESTRVTISPDSKLLAAACAHGVRLWNVEEARQVASLNIGNVIDTYFSPNGDWLATDSTEVFYLWDVNMMLGAAGDVQIQPLLRVPKAKKRFMGDVVTASPNGGWVFTLSSGEVRVENVSSTKKYTIGRVPSSYWSRELLGPMSDEGEGFIASRESEDDVVVFTIWKCSLIDQSTPEVMSSPISMTSPTSFNSPPLYTSSTFLSPSTSR